MLNNQGLNGNRNTVKSHQSHGKAIKTAVILAAGMGLRLTERGKRMPKGCMRLGEKSIVEESVLRLLSVGIERIVIVTGHFAQQYEPLQDRYRQAVQLVHNPYFADSGSMYSLYCARHCVDEAFLLLESDLVYERRSLTACLEHPSDNVVLLADVSGSRDEVFVETNDGHLVTMSKNRARLGSEVPGELVGISKISRSLFSVMLDAAEQCFRTTRHMSYETDALVAATQDVSISCPVVKGLVWCEIDDETHLARARNEIYPVVQAKDAETDVYDGERLQRHLGKFKTIGFFGERDLIIRHMEDFFATVNEHQVRASIIDAGVNAPLEMVRDGSAASYSDALPGSLEEHRIEIAMTFAFGLIAAALVFRSQRRHDRRFTLVWVVFVFLAGAPGYLAYLFHDRWPVSLPCSNCGRSVPHNRSSCFACDTAFPVPEKNGSEVYA